MEIVNKVAQSGIITINLEHYYPEGGVMPFDLKDFLFKGLILREKDFREGLAAVDWQQYERKVLAIYCSADAIIPQWAYMLVAVYAAPHVQSLFFGTPETVLGKYYDQVVDNLDTSAWEGQRIVIKGCSDKPVPADAYVALTRKLRPLAQSIMYGEPCSTVPLYKRKATK